MRKNLATLWILTTLLLGLAGCAGVVQPQAAQQTIIVNENLSGTIRIGVAYTNSDFDLLQSSYDIVSLTASQLGDVTGWQSYDTNTTQESGYQWVTISHDFDTVEEFYALISAGSLVSDTTTGAGGSGSGTQYPPLSLQKKNSVFKTEYRFENTLIALAATNATIPTTLQVQLPGKIVSTNGRILNDGKTVEWEWGAYDYVPVALVTETTNTGWILVTILGLSCLCLFVIIGLAVVIYFLMKKKRPQSPNHLDKGE
ncbi:MAG: hypothetical protein HFACDABA_02920 [Anaerolineales bacterium]|nr:hypothetical protein [Anaerolineales bacterium]